MANKERIENRGAWMKEATPEERSRVARLGGLHVSKNREHMSEIGRKGASVVIKKYGREHMREIGKRSWISRKPKN